MRLVSLSKAYAVHSPIIPAPSSVSTVYEVQALHDVSSHQEEHVPAPMMATSTSVSFGREVPHTREYRGR